MSNATTHIETEKQFTPELRFKEFDGVILKKRFDEIIDRITYGFTNPMPEAELGPYLITARDVKFGQIQYDSCRRTTEEAFETLVSDKSRPNIGDILLTKDGTLGRVALVDRENCCINQSVALIQPGKDFDSQFLKQVLLSQAYQNEMLRNAGGSTIKHLYITTVGKMLVVHPPVPEQQKIASFLSAVDEKIQQLTKKKALLEQYKKGVMQQLFSSQLRFKDENGNAYPDWEEKFLGEMTERNICYGVVQPGIEDDNGVKFIRGGDVFNGKISDDLRIISKEITDKYQRTYLKGGELIMSLVGYPGETAIVPMELSGANLARQVGLIDLKKEYVSGYIHFYINSIYGKKNLLGKTIGSAQQVINIIDLKKLKVPFPSKPEQQKIATYLSSIDTKIEAVNNQITQTQTFKKGLLQRMFV
jgi:type I restriction enzyme S subunit